MNMHQQGGVASVEGACAGIDVSKTHLDLCVGTTAQRLPNDSQGSGALTALLQSAKVDLVVVEATGGYERGLVCALQSAGLCVARVNPRQARGFAKAMGVRAAGKPKKVTIVACMRKLLTILNAMLRDQAVWNAAKQLASGPTA